ncbi:MAG TPA: hypothetical protein DHV44_00610 [Providencia sp.]|nr:hypothetical protein [Providencia sp.]
MEILSVLNVKVLKQPHSLKIKKKASLNSKLKVELLLEKGNQDLKGELRYHRQKLKLLDQK